MIVMHDHTTGNTTFADVAVGATIEDGDLVIAVRRAGALVAEIRLPRTCGAPVSLLALAARRQPMCLDLTGATHAA